MFKNEYIIFLLLFLIALWFCNGVITKACSTIVRAIEMPDFNMENMQIMKMYLGIILGLSFLLGLSLGFILGGGV